MKIRGYMDMYVKCHIHGNPGVGYMHARIRDEARTQVDSFTQWGDVTPLLILTNFGTFGDDLDTA
jgi:hypothetical protein